MNKLELAFIYTLFLSMTGCASIAGENTRDVKIESRPAGAAIFVDNKQYGVTPAVITLQSYIYGGKSVILRKPGYQEQTMAINTTFQPIALLDILLWPTFFIDAATGNLVKIDSASLNINSTLRHK